MTFGAWTTSRLRRACGALALVAVTAVLVACGGGTTQSEVFVPARYFAFGDETSVITATGRRYAVNVLGAGDVVDCKLEPIWVQALATQYGFSFSQCPNGTLPHNALMRANAGATVDGLKVQIDTQVANGGFAAKDLATVLVGANDVLAVYAGFPQRTEEQLLAEVRARGERLALQVNRLVDLGVRVIVSTIPDLGVTPYGRKQKALLTDTDRAALLSRLTAAFNGRLRVGILNDGRFVGLILADELTQTMALAPSAFGLTNVSDAVCAVALPDCTSATLVPSGSSSTYLWADDTQMGFAGQQRLGSLLIQRAIGNPF